MSNGKKSEPVDSPVFAHPVPCLHVIGVRVFGEPGRLSLLGGEVALLLLSELEEATGCFPVRLSHSTILQVS